MSVNRSNCGPDMRGKLIKRHISEYYSSLYRGRRECRAPVERGRDLARLLNYPSAVIEAIPDELWDHFVPCGNPFPFLIKVATGPGLNLGCGAAIDSIGLARGLNIQHPIVNVDIVAHVLAGSRRILCQNTPAGSTLSWTCAEAEHLPFRPESFHWVLMNGVFNLFPEKMNLLKEIRRVLHHGGQLVIMDLFHQGSMPDYFKEELDAWVWCMNGALDQTAALAVLEQTGFKLLEFKMEEDMDLFYRAGVLAQMT